MTTLGWHGQWWSLYNRMWQWRLVSWSQTRKVVSCEAGTSQCVYDVIAEVLYCYKCILLFVIQNNVNLFYFIITILENIAVVNALQHEATRTTLVLSHLITTPCLCWSHWAYLLPYSSILASEYITLHWDLDFWPFDLDLWLKVSTKFDRNQAIPAELMIILQIFARIMSHGDLDLWPLELSQHFTVLNCMILLHFH